jgi:hypothetical protein
MSYTGTTYKDERARCKDILLHTLKDTAKDEAKKKKCIFLSFRNSWKTRNNL